MLTPIVALMWDVTYFALDHMTPLFTNAALAFSAAEFAVVEQEHTHRQR